MSNQHNNFILNKIGLLALMSVSVGLIIAQTGLISLLRTAALGQSGFIIALGIAFIIALTYVVTFSELTLMFPWSSGGLATSTPMALGQLPTVVAMFSAYIIPPILGMAAEVYLLDSVISSLFPGALPPMALAIMIVVLFTLMNLKGIDVFAKIQRTIVTLILMMLVVAIIKSFVMPEMESARIAAESTPFNPMGIEILSLIALAIWCIVGAEFATFMAPNAENAAKNIPRAMGFGLLVIVSLYAALGYGVQHILSPEQIMATETPHVVFFLTVFGEHSKLLVAFAVLVATSSCLNSVMASTPKMLLGMAENHQVFPIFKKVNKNGVPWVGTVFMGVIILVPLMLMQSMQGVIFTLLIAAGVSWMMTYIIAHITLIVLRFRYPNADRPFKTPFYPIPQMIGIAGFSYIAINCAPTPEMTWQVYGIAGGLISLVALIGALWIKLYMKEALFSPVPLDEMRALHDESNQKQKTAA